MWAWDPTHDCIVAVFGVATDPATPSSGTTAVKLLTGTVSGTTVDWSSVTDITAQFAVGALADYAYIPSPGNAMQISSAGVVTITYQYYSPLPPDTTAIDVYSLTTSYPYTTWTLGGLIQTSGAGNETQIALQPSGYLLAKARGGIGASAGTARLYKSTNGGTSWSAVTISTGTPYDSLCTSGLGCDSDGLNVFTSPDPGGSSTDREFLTAWFSSDEGTVWNTSQGSVPGSNFPGGTILDDNPYIGSNNLGGNNYTAVAACSGWPSAATGDTSGDFFLLSPRAWPNTAGIASGLYPLALHRIARSWLGAPPLQAISPSPAEIPANYGANITIALTGDGTDWVSGTTTFSLSGVSGVTLVSHSITSTTAATIVVTTGSGTGTLTITDSSANTGTVSVGIPTLSVSTSAGLYVTATGSYTLWSTETASTLFSASAGTISSVSVNTDTNATFAFVPSANEVVTVTDNSAGATATFTVGGYGSTRIVGNWYVQTAANGLLSDQTTCSLSFFIQFNKIEIPAHPEDTPFIMTQQSGGGITIGGAVYSGDYVSTQISFLANGTDAVGFDFTFQIGQPYHVVLVWSPTAQTWYINNVVQESQTNSDNTTANTSNHAFQIGLQVSSDTTVDIQISNPAMWNGGALIAADILGLRNRTLTPNQVSIGAPNAWWPMGGPANANPLVTDIGMLDQSGNNSNFSATFGTSTNAFYAGELIYTPPTIVVPYIGKSGLWAHFFATSAVNGIPESITSIASQPTIYVNGNSVSFLGPLWLRQSQTHPIASYYLLCGPVASIMVTNGGSGYSSSPTASASGGGDGSGLELGSPVVTGGVTSYAVTNGGLDYTYTPYVTVEGGGGSGAIGKCVMSGGSVQSISVWTPGSGFTSTPTVVFNVPDGVSGSGSGATATCSVSNVIESIPVIAGGSGYTEQVTITVHDDDGSGASAIALMGGVQPTDVVTYSATDSWLFSAVGQAPAAPSQYASDSVANYSGQPEPGVGGYLPLDVPNNLRTLPIGFNSATPTVNSGGEYSTCANWMKRANIPWTNAVTSTQDGHPLTITGTASTEISWLGYDNFIDGRNYPTPIGVWTLVVDDTSQETPMTFAMTGDESSGGFGVTTEFIPGTLVDGVWIGRTWQFTVTRSGNPTSWSQYLSITATVEGASGTYPYTAQNEFLFAPGNTPNRSIPLGIDANTAAWVTTPSGKTPYTVRFLDSCTYSYADASSVVDPPDLLPPTNFSWNQQTVTSNTSLSAPRHIHVETIRPYSLTAVTGTPGSPYVYMSQWNGVAQSINSILVTDGGSGYSNSPTVTASGGGGSGLMFGTVTVTNGVITAIAVDDGGSDYTTPPQITITDSSGTGAAASAIAQISPASIGYFNDAGTNSQWFVGEAVCTANHGLKSGQQLSWVSGNTTFTITNGDSNTLSTSLNGVIEMVVFPTGLQTFAFTWFDGYIRVPVVGMPGNINNVVGSTSVTAEFLVQVPDPSVYPYACCATMAGQLANTNAYVNVPYAATDLTGAAIASAYLDNFPAGRKVYVEFSDEDWNYSTSGSFMFALANLGVIGSDLGSAPQGYVVRASQHHDAFYSVFNAAGRGAEIKRIIGADFADPGYTGELIGIANANGIKVDCVAVAPYTDIPSETSDPTTACTANPTGGGSSGGNLPAGVYIAYYTYVEAASGIESTVGSSSSGAFTVASGDIPQLTFPALPAFASSMNVYLTAAGGSAGSETLYAKGITGTTKTLSSASWYNDQTQAEAPSPPTVNQCLSTLWMVESLVPFWPSSAAYLGSVAFTRTAYLEWFRHWIKYNQQVNGPNGYYASHIANLASYTVTPTIPQLMSYEGSVERYMPSGLSGADPTNHYLNNQLTHDLFYDPENYWVEMAFIGSCQQGGLAFTNFYALSDLPGGTGALAADALFMWGYVLWAQQAAGHGDGTAATNGQNVTNLFWMNTGVAQHLNNVSPRLQAWRDWADVANPVIATRVPAVRRWFPGLSRRTRARFGR